MKNKRRGKSKWTTQSQFQIHLKVCQKSQDRASPLLLEVDGMYSSRGLMAIPTPDGFFPSRLGIGTRPFDIRGKRQSHKSGQLVRQFQARHMSQNWKGNGIFLCNLVGHCKTCPISGQAVCPLIQLCTSKQEGRLVLTQDIIIKGQLEGCSYAKT